MRGISHRYGCFEPEPVVEHVDRYDVPGRGVGRKVIRYRCQECGRAALIDSDDEEGSDDAAEGTD